MDSSPFHARPRIKTALPLPLGASSLAEIMEVELTTPMDPEEFRRKFAAQLPEVCVPNHTASHLCGAWRRLQIWPCPSIRRWFCRRALGKLCVLHQVLPAVGFRLTFSPHTGAAYPVRGGNARVQAERRGGGLVHLAAGHRRVVRVMYKLVVTTNPINFSLVVFALSLSLGWLAAGSWRCRCCRPPPRICTRRRWTR